MPWFVTSSPRPRMWRSWEEQLEQINREQARTFRRHPFRTQASAERAARHLSTLPDHAGNYVHVHKAPEPGRKSRGFGATFYRGQRLGQFYERKVGPAGKYVHRGERVHGFQPGRGVKRPSRLRRDAQEPVWIVVDTERRDRILGRHRSRTDARNDAAERNRADRSMRYAYMPEYALEGGF